MPSMDCRAPVGARSCDSVLCQRLKKQPLKNQRLFSLSVIRKDQFSLHSDVVQVQVVVVVMLSWQLA